MRGLRRRLEYLVVMTVRAVARLIPRPASLALGSALGRVFYHLHRHRRALALENLRAAFPAKADAECTRILRATFDHFGRHVIELLRFDAMSTNEMEALVELEGVEHVEQAMARGRGVMFYTGHFGYWELQIMVHAIPVQADRDGGPYARQPAAGAAHGADADAGGHPGHPGVAVPSGDCCVP